MVAIVIAFFGLAITSYTQTTTKKTVESLPDKKLLLTLLQSSLDEITALVTNLTEEQFVQIPADSTWSAGQIVEHLSQIEDGFLREYFVAINIPPADSKAKIVYTTDSLMLAYESTPEKTKARGTNLPLNRYCHKADAIRILVSNRSETIRVITDEKRDMRKVFTYRAKANQTFEARDMYQHFLLLAAHMKRHTIQLKKVLTGL